jgi:hypothetical protein
MLATVLATALWVTAPGGFRVGVASPNVPAPPDARLWITAHRTSAGSRVAQAGCPVTSPCVPMMPRERCSRGATSLRLHP